MTMDYISVLRSNCLRTMFFLHVHHAIPPNLLADAPEGGMKGSKPTAAKSMAKATPSPQACWYLKLYLSRVLICLGSVIYIYYIYIIYII